MTLCSKGQLAVAALASSQRTDDERIAFVDLDGNQMYRHLDITLTADELKEGVLMMPAGESE